MMRRSRFATVLSTETGAQSAIAHALSPTQARSTDTPLPIPDRGRSGGDRRMRRLNWRIEWIKFVMAQRWTARLR